MNVLLVITGDTGLQYHRQLSPHAVMQRVTPCKIDTTQDFDNVPDSKLKEYQVVQFIRCISNTGKTKEVIDRCHKAGAKVVFDIDDHYNLPTDHGIYRQKKLEYESAEWKRKAGMKLSPQEEKVKPYSYQITDVKDALKYSDLVTTTTQHFRSELKTGEVLPNCIDTAEPQWQQVNYYSNHTRFGWIGGMWHTHDVELLRDSMNKLYTDRSLSYQIVLGGFNLERDFHKKVERFHKENDHLKGIPPYALKLDEINRRKHYLQYENVLTANYNLSKEFVSALNTYDENNEYVFYNEKYRRVWGTSWREYGKIYNQIDVSLVPLRSNQFASCKSPLKLVEAGTMKKAVIASDCLPYSVFPKNTYYAINVTDNRKGWYKAIKAMLQSEQMRNDYSSALYEYVRREFNAEQWAMKRYEIYKQLIG